MRKSIVRILIFTAYLTLLQPMKHHAQQTGNIVEVFGKEKVEVTEEGAVYHHFTKAFLLKDAMIPGMLTAGQDIVFWQMVAERFEKPEHGMLLKDNYRGRTNPMQWELIEADSAGVFTGELGRAYLYTALESPDETIALLDATGHTRVYINGLPHEGDHYDYGWTLIPFHLKKGLNQFVYTYGRFPRITSKIVIPKKDLQFSKRDMTLPSILRGSNGLTWGAVRIVNATDLDQRGLNIACTLETGESIIYQTDEIMQLAVRKVKFQVPAPANSPLSDSLMATLVLTDRSGNELDRMIVKLNVKDATRHHERTFISAIDGSVQYYSVAPSLSAASNQALVLTVHGASVEATNQARAYRQKDWCFIVAPTNRRPFGFNWEEWGRIDALEVLDDARRTFQTNSRLTYLTGHSMGGHGTWFLGATYPDTWAAIAPAAAYPDIIGYRRTGSDSLMKTNSHFEMVYRGALAGRTVDLARNYLQSGVYVLHGDADAVVPVEQARMMRSVLGGFHNNFAYYEYPGGSHWYGDHCVDWPPLFDFLKQNTIPAISGVDSLEFITASPGISASNYWLQINQQLSCYRHSRVKAVKNGDTIYVESENVKSLTLMTSQLNFDRHPVVVINSELIKGEKGSDMHLLTDNDKWVRSSRLNLKEKHPGRYGGFKLAFDNNVVFVYATNGDDKENEWYKNKARFDAETFLYRGNSSVDVVADKDLDPGMFNDRNVILYGNADNNLAWNLLLDDCPVKVNNEGIRFGEQFYEGEDLGVLFIYPRSGTDKASVGVVAGTGKPGMMAACTNEYFSGITGFPDLLMFHTGWIRDGLGGIKMSGFFGYDWSVEHGQWVE